MAGNVAKRKGRADRVSFTFGKVVKVKAEGWGLVVAPLLVAFVAAFAVVAWAFVDG